MEVKAGQLFEMHAVLRGSQTNSSLEFWVINLRLGVLGFWAWDEFWEQIVPYSF